MRSHKNANATRSMRVIAFHENAGRCQVGFDFALPKFAFLPSGAIRARTFGFGVHSLLAKWRRSGLSLA